MTIRRVDKGGSIASSGKGRSVSGAGGENFSLLLESVAAVRGNPGIMAVGGVTGAGDEPSPRQKRQELDQARELLDSLESLGQDLDNPAVGLSGARLRDSRDQALHTLSELPRGGEERDLLHRTAVLATVELAKSDRGDYQ